MKFGKRKLAVAFGAILGFGIAGQASADVYGLGYLNVDNLVLTINATSGGAGAFLFEGNQDAVLNGAPDPSAGNSICGGLFGVGNDCAAGSPRLSGKVQNAPPAVSGVRGEGDYTIYGMVGNYSNAEAEIVRAVLTGDAVTQVTSISESNLDTYSNAQANTTMGSNTDLSLTFAVGPAGTLTIEFDADVNVATEVTEGDIGLARAATSASFILQKQVGGVGTTVASWAPTGTNTVTTCAGGLTCTATETALSLNNTSSSSGARNEVVGSGKYKLEVSGLTSGNYTLALTTTTSTGLIKIPVPSTLFLMGAGLLLGARATRRKK